MPNGRSDATALRAGTARRVGSPRPRPESPSTGRGHRDSHLRSRGWACPQSRTTARAHRTSEKLADARLGAPGGCHHDRRGDRQCPYKLALMGRSLARTRSRSHLAGVNPTSPTTAALESNSWKNRDMPRPGANPA